MEHRDKDDRVVKYLTDGTPIPCTAEEWPEMCQWLDTRMEMAAFAFQTDDHAALCREWERLTKKFSLKGG